MDGLSSKISENVQRGAMSSARATTLSAPLHLCFITPVRLRTTEMKNKSTKYIDVELAPLEIIYVWWLTDRGSTENPL